MIYEIARARNVVRLDSRRGRAPRSRRCVSVGRAASSAPKHMPRGRVSSSSRRQASVGASTFARGGQPWGGDEQLRPASEKDKASLCYPSGEYLRPRGFPSLASTFASDVLLRGGEQRRPLRKRILRWRVSSSPKKAYRVLWFTRLPVVLPC